MYEALNVGVHPVDAFTPSAAWIDRLGLRQEAQISGNRQSLLSRTAPLGSESCFLF
jgi:hypothetical protein